MAVGVWKGYLQTAVPAMIWLNLNDCFNFTPRLENLITSPFSLSPYFSLTFYICLLLSPVFPPLVSLSLSLSLFHFLSLSISLVFLFWVSLSLSNPWCNAVTHIRSEHGHEQRPLPDKMCDPLLISSQVIILCSNTDSHTLTVLSCANAPNAMCCFRHSREWAGEQTNAHRSSPRSSPTSSYLLYKPAVWIYSNCQKDSWSTW